MQQVSVPRRSDERALRSAARAEVWTMMRIGGFDEAVVRSLLFVLDCGERFDEQALRRVWRRLPDCCPRLDTTRLARIVDDQAAVLRLDQTIAVESLPALLPDDDNGATQLLERVAWALGGAGRDAAVARRFARLARIVSFA